MRTHGGGFVPEGARGTGEVTVKAIEAVVMTSISGTRPAGQYKAILHLLFGMEYMGIHSFLKCLPGQ